MSFTCCCSVAKLCLTLGNPMDCSTLGFPVLQYLLQFAQTHIHCADDAIQPSHPLSPLLLLPSIFPSITVFSNESFLPIKWPKYWSFSISSFNEYSGLISFWFDCSPRDFQESSPTPQFESINFLSYIPLMAHFC